MQTLLLGPAAAAFAIVLVVASVPQRSPDLESALRACSVAIPLGVAAFIFEQIKILWPSRTIGVVRTLLYLVLGNTGQIFLVAGLYYFIRSMDATAAGWFLRISLVAYLGYAVLYLPGVFLSAAHTLKNVHISAGETSGPIQDSERLDDIEVRLEQEREKKA
jgi:hypothetical protein